MVNIYKFRNCILNVTERRVLRDGDYLDMTTKAFDVLRLLIERQGEIVTKDEILGEVWNGSFVEEGNLAVHVSKLRRTLDETRENPFIETVQGTGYRFIAAVTEGNVEEWDSLVGGIVTPPKDEKNSEWAFDSIAVMPLENVTRDEEIDYLADGLTESFINSLSRFANLKVIARNTVFRYKDKKFDAKQVGETLGVATVMTGRIRLIQDRLSITIELTKTSDSTQLWGTHIQRPFNDIFEIQDSILAEVTESLRRELQNAQNRSRKNEITRHSESYRLYLKGTHLLKHRTVESMTKAQECFKKSLPYDPTNIYSHLELVESFVGLYVSSFISFDTFLHKIDPILSAIADLKEVNDAVHLTYAKLKYFEWDFKQSRRHIQSALRLNPNNIGARFFYAQLLLTIGDYSEALKELSGVIQFDPLSFQSYIAIGRTFYRMGKFDSAIVYLSDVVDLEPNNFEALALYGATLAELGEFDRANEVFETSLRLHDHIETVSMLGYVAAKKGDRRKAKSIIARINKDYPKNSEKNTVLARIYSALNETDAAFDLLDMAFANHEPDLIAINSDPRLTNLKNAPRLKSLVQRVGLTMPPSYR